MLQHGMWLADRSTYASAYGVKPAGSASSSREVDRPTILWIDDEIGPADAAIRFLAAEGFRLHCAATGGAGLDLARTGNFDAIILDLKLPDMSGLAVLRSLRGEGIHTPVLVLTGYPDFDSAFSAGRLGAVDYRLKATLFVDEMAVLLKRMLGVANSSEEKPDIGFGQDSVPFQNPLTDSVRALVSLLAKLSQRAEDDAEGRVPESQQHGGKQQLLAAQLQTLVDPGLTVPLFLTCAQAFQQTIAAPKNEPVSRLARSVRTVMERQEQRAVLPRHPKVREAISKLEAGVKDHVHLSEQAVADQLAIDRAHLGRLIRADTGLSFREWRASLRIQSAVRELVSTSEQISQIAYHVLQHPSKFDRDFRAIFGIAPRQLRDAWIRRCSNA